MKKKKEIPQSQMLFDFAGGEIREPKSAYGSSPSTAPYKYINFKRAIIAWLMKDSPSGIGITVPTRFSKYRADIAAFWSKPVKGKCLMPAKTVIIETRLNRDECWPECSGKEDILAELKAKKEDKRKLEAEIRKTEPELKDTDNLFNEYESWNYLKSGNKKYHKCLRKIEDLEHSLYKGSRFEQIRRAHVANQLYLAVPANIVHADELADGWGLIFVHSNLKAEIVKESETWDCPENNKLHLVQNIAASCIKSLLVCFGIREDSGGKLVFTRIPRKPRAQKKDLKLNI